MILPYFWLLEETLELRVKRDHVPYDIWERQGYIQTTEGNVVHYGYIESFIEKLGERFNIKKFPLIDGVPFKQKRLMVRLQQSWHLIGQLGVGIKIQKVFMIVEVFCLCRISFRKVPV